MLYSSRKCPKDYTVAIICALETEFTAVRGMLDREHPRLPLSSATGDTNIYSLGELQKHNVVIACLPNQQGKGAAATVVTNLSRTFTGILWRFLVGIGGGIPSAKNDIRLGDVVVSLPEGTHGGVIQYDLGRDTEDGFVLKSFLHPPPALLRSAVINMQSDHRFQESRVSRYVIEMLENHPRLNHYAKLSAEDFQRDSSRARYTSGPEIHYGLIASGDAVIKRKTRRDELVRLLGNVLCVEMEAAGLLSSSECIVIRGIADYADELKNDDWQCYAAATAAACAKELLAYIGPPEAPQELRNKAPPQPANQTSSGGRYLQEMKDTSTIHGNGIINSGSGSMTMGNITF